MISCLLTGNTEPTVADERTNESQPDATRGRSFWLLRSFWYALIFREGKYGFRPSGFRLGQIAARKEKNCAARITPRCLPSGDDYRSSAPWRLLPTIMNFFPCLRGPTKKHVKNRSISMLEYKLETKEYTKLRASATKLYQIRHIFDYIKYTISLDHSTKRQTSITCTDRRIYKYTSRTCATNGNVQIFLFKSTWKKLLYNHLNEVWKRDTWEQFQHLDRRKQLPTIARGKWEKETLLTLGRQSIRTFGRENPYSQLSDNVGRKYRAQRGW